MKQYLTAEDALTRWSKVRMQAFVVESLPALQRYAMAPAAATVLLDALSISAPDDEA